MPAVPGPHASPQPLSEPLDLSTWRRSWEMGELPHPLCASPCLRTLAQAAGGPRLLLSLCAQAWPRKRGEGVRARMCLPGLAQLQQLCQQTSAPRNEHGCVPDTPHAGGSGPPGTDTPTCVSCPPPGELLSAAPQGRGEDGVCGCLWRLPVSCWEGPQPTRCQQRLIFSPEEADTAGRGSAGGQPMSAAGGGGALSLQRSL